MHRLALGLATGLAAVMVASAALAADYPWMSDDPLGGMKPSYSDDSWDGSDPNSPIGIELGLRYWYSMGAQKFSIGPNDLATDDKASSAEIAARVDDYSTGTYLKGVAGTSFAIDGSASGTGTKPTISNGHVTYAGADVGFTTFGDPRTASIGPFIGYMYWNDSPNSTLESDSNNYTTAQSASDIGYDPITGKTTIPGDSTANNLDINALRLGVSGKAKMGMFDVDGEVAAVPYARVGGVLGATLGTTVCCSTLGNVEQMTASPTRVDGWGYGAMAELLLGFHPTDNLTIRLGGRAWYLQGKVDGTYTEATIGDPSKSVPTGNYNQPPNFSKQDFIYRDSPFSLLRYGALAELTWKF